MDEYTQGKEEALDDIEKYGIQMALSVIKGVTPSGRWESFDQGYIDAVEGARI